jgi:hypothetical protein
MSTSASTRTMPFALSLQLHSSKNFNLVLPFLTIELSFAQLTYFQHSEIILDGKRRIEITSDKKFNILNMMAG